MEQARAVLCDTQLYFLKTFTCTDSREVWKIPAAPETMRQPVASTIPTLLILGSFDTLTSLAGAAAAAARLSKAKIISIPGIGHSVAPQSPCAQTVIVSFLADPSSPTRPVSAF